MQLHNKFFPPKLGAGIPASSGADGSSIAIGVTVIVLGFCLVLCGVLTIVGIVVYKRVKANKSQAYDTSGAAFKTE